MTKKKLAKEAKQFAHQAFGRLDFLFRGETVPLKDFDEVSEPAQQAMAMLISKAVGGDLWATDFLKSTLHANPVEREAARERINQMHKGRLPKHINDKQ